MDSLGLVLIGWAVGVVCGWGLAVLERRYEGSEAESIPTPTPDPARDPAPNTPLPAWKVRHLHRVESMRPILGDRWADGEIRALEGER